MMGMAPLPFSLGRRLLLCMAMLALESFVSYEELFMLPMLQRVGVPTAVLSLSGLLCVVAIFTSSSGPYLDWASDRFTCSRCRCGQKRPYAVLALSVMVAGGSVLLGLVSLYGNPEDNNMARSNDVDRACRTETTDFNPPAATRVSTRLNRGELFFPSSKCGADLMWTATVQTRFFFFFFFHSKA